MATNKFSQECKDCGEIVLPGKGILTSEWSNQDDETAWVVRHADKSICKAVEADRTKEQSHNNNIGNGIAQIKRNGTRSDKVTDGEQVIYDGRRGYNFIGWLLTRTGNTLYLTSRSNLDGHDMSETYIYGGSQSKIEDLLWTMELI